MKKKNNKFECKEITDKNHDLQTSMVGKQTNKQTKKGK